MDDNSDFSDEFCQFLQASVPTVDAAELLLLLYGNPEAAWTRRDVAARLEPGASLSEADAAKYLDGFLSRGLIAGGADGRVRYEPASRALNAHVRMLEKLYNERPVTLFRIIYTLRDTRIKTFADAFKIWRT